MCGAKAAACRGLSQNASVMCCLEGVLVTFAERGDGLDIFDDGQPILLHGEDRRVLEFESVALLEQLGQHGGERIVLAAVDMIEKARLEDRLFADAGVRAPWRWRCRAPCAIRARRAVARARAHAGLARRRCCGRSRRGRLRHEGGNGCEARRAMTEGKRMTWKKSAGSAAAPGGGWRSASTRRNDHFAAEHDGVVGHAVGLLDRGGRDLVFRS